MLMQRLGFGHLDPLASGQPMAGLGTLEAERHQVGGFFHGVFLLPQDWVVVRALMRLLHTRRRWQAERKHPALGGVFVFRDTLVSGFH